jgi:hypothetical protein
MLPKARYHWPLAFLLAVLLGILFLTLRPYNQNPSALFHLDELTESTYGVPKDFVVLNVPGYDGEQYYEIARRMPSVFQPTKWPLLAANPTQAYSYQRFLLPLAAYGLSFGKEEWLPEAFLLIHIGSLLIVAFTLLLWYPRKPLYALALALCPAALLGLHFSLAEPLTLALLTAFLIRFINRSKLHTLDVILLALFVLTREVNIIFIGLLLLYLLWNRRWQDSFLLIIPIISFVGLHTLIYEIFHEVPFLWSTDKRSIPLQAIVDLLRGANGYTSYTLSSIALFLVFVLPATLWSAWNLWKRTMPIFLPLFTLVFLCVMLTMPGHIWGSITSIGRVITPVYPLFLLQAAERDTIVARAISIAVLLLGVGVSLSLAMLPHPFFLS